MASKFNKGDSVFFLMQDGKSVLDSQLKPRMYKSVEACKGHYPAWRDGEAGIIEYAPIVRCKDCIHRETVEGGKDYCCINMCACMGYCSVGEKRESTDVTD